MARAVRHQEELNRLMANEAGVLAIVAAARQDLWRLAHMALYLRLGCAAMRRAGRSVDPDAAKLPGSRLRRRLRRALIAYARVSLRGKAGKDPVIVVARSAALREIGKRGIEDVDRLIDIETLGGSGQAIIRMGVARPLHDLHLDWHSTESEPS